MVVGSCPVQVVRCTGGWLFDQVMAGWEAAVLLADGSDSRSLRILGACPAELDSGLAWSVRGPQSQAIAVEADLYASDARVRRIVRNALREGAAEVTFWGGWWPADLDGGQSVQHRLSVAARAFKAQALAAAAVPVESMDVTETFHHGEPPSIRPVSDLITAT